MEVREVTKLLLRDMTSSNDDFTSYRQSIKLIPTPATTPSVNNETPDTHLEGVTLSKFIHEGRPTSTKPTFVDLPNLTSHSTQHECSRGIFYQPQYSPHGPLTKLGVIILYFLRLERKIISPSTFIIRWNTTTESTLTKWIYSTSKKTTTFQVGIQPSNFLTKSTKKLLAQEFTSTSKEFISIRHPIPIFLHPTFTATQVTNAYGAYTASPAKKIT